MNKIFNRWEEVYDVMTNGELFPFIFLFGSACLLILILAFPIWLYSELTSLHRSIRYLREDLESQEEEIKQLRDKLIPSENS